MLYFAFGLGLPELVIILVIVLVLFGAGKLPKVMAQLGKGTKAFKDGVKGEATDEAAPDQIDVTPGLSAVEEAIEIESQRAD